MCCPSSTRCYLTHQIIKIGMHCKPLIIEHKITNVPVPKDTRNGLGPHSFSFIIQLQKVHPIPTDRGREGLGLLYMRFGTKSRHLSRCTHVRRIWRTVMEDVLLADRFWKMHLVFTLAGRRNDFMYDYVDWQAILNDLIVWWPGPFGCDTKEYLRNSCL